MANIDVDQISILVSDARTRLALRQPVDLEPLLDALDDLIGLSNDLANKVDHCELYHNDDDDDDEPPPAKKGE